MRKGRSSTFSRLKGLLHFSDISCQFPAKLQNPARKIASLLCILYVSEMAAQEPTEAASQLQSDRS